MKKALIFLLSITAAACGTKDIAKTGQTVDFSFVMDTVSIDAGEEFIHVSWNLTTSDLSPDGKYLYNFRTGAKVPALELINLESGKLEEIIPMSLDGPNRVHSPYMNQIYVQDDGTFFLSDGDELSHFDQSGNKLLALDYAEHDFEGEKLPADMRTTLQETLSDDGKTVLTLYGDQALEKSPFGVAVFDLEKRYFAYTLLDVFKELDPYRVNIYRDGKPGGSKFAAIRLMLKNDSLIFSNSAKNEIGFYDLKTDSLSKKRFSSQYTSQEASPNISSRIETEQEFEELLKKTDQDVQYGRFFFDSENQVYWRFAKEMDRMVGDSVVYKTVLTAFDTDFNQLGEKLLSEDFVLPSKYFVRKGIIYTFLNVEDEVAFVRIIPDFDS